MRFLTRGTPAKLPEHLLDTQIIAKLEPGQSGYTLPWAIWVDLDMNCWINQKYPCYPKPGGTASMLVYRNDAGIIARPPAGTTYQPTAGIPWVGATEDDILPVVEVI